MCHRILILLAAFLIRSAVRQRTRTRRAARLAKPLRRRARIPARAAWLAAPAAPTPKKVWTNDDVAGPARGLRDFHGR